MHSYERLLVCICFRKLRKRVLDEKRKLNSVIPSSAFHALTLLGLTATSGYK